MNAITALLRGAGRSMDRPRIDTRPSIVTGVIAFVVLVGLLGSWSEAATIGGAVVAGGRVAVSGHSKSVQHPDGGTIATIAVGNGDSVEEGQVLVTLDPTLVTANLDIARRRLAAALALKARLVAEHRGLVRIDFSLPSLPAAVDAASLPLAPEIAGQQEIFDARQDMLNGGRARLVETLAQIDDQIAGASAQVDAALEQMALIDPQIATKRALIADGLARQSELNALLTSRAEIEGRRAQLISEQARLEAAKRQSEVETQQSERAFREDVATRLSEAEGQIEELLLEIITRQNRLDRMEIRAPVSGLVHELQVSTIGGVVAPGATLLDIVPHGRAAGVEVQVDPTMVDQVHPGQTAELIFPAFDQNETPRLNGKVRTISAAAIEDSRSGMRFYRVEIDVPPEEFDRLGGHTPVPGMPVEAYLATGDRTVLTYLMAPITTHLRRAFRD